MAAAVVAVAAAEVAAGARGDLGTQRSGSGSWTPTRYSDDTVIPKPLIRLPAPSTLPDLTPRVHPLHPFLVPSG